VCAWAQAWGLCLLTILAIMGPIRLVSVILLHEEIRRVLLPDKAGADSTQVPFLMKRGSSGPVEAGIMHKSFKRIPTINLNPAIRASGSRKLADHARVEPAPERAVSGSCAADS